MKLPMLLALGVIFGVALTSCAGTGEGGAWTAADTAATVGAVNQIYDTGARVARDYNNGYQGYPVTPVVPVTPVAPVYPVRY